MTNSSKTYLKTKRVLDLVWSLLLLILFSPLLALTAIAVRLNLGGPVIFVQARPGMNEKIFHLYKFRTMKNIDESRGLIEDSVRLTRFGKFLRASSLDELPSLFNVLRGQMSFVGPRPLLVEYLPLYSEFQRIRHSVRPGITGLAQANGRNLLSWEEKFNLDVQYVNQISFVLDFRILIQTAGVTILRKNINSPGSATSEKFIG